MKKCLFLILTAIIMIPQACKKEDIQEEPTVWVTYNAWAPNPPIPKFPWADDDIEKTYNKQSIIDFFKDRGIKIIEVKLSTEMPGPHLTGPGGTYVYCRIFEQDVTAIQEYGFRL